MVYDPIVAAYKAIREADLAYDPQYMTGIHEMGHALDLAGDTRSWDRLSPELMVLYQKQHPQDQFPSRENWNSWLREQLPGASFWEYGNYDPGSPYANPEHGSNIREPETLANAFEEAELRGDQASPTAQMIRQMMVEEAQRQQNSSYPDPVVEPQVPQAFQNAVSTMHQKYPQIDVNKVWVDPNIPHEFGSTTVHQDNGHLSSDIGFDKYYVEHPQGMTPAYEEDINWGIQPQWMRKAIRQAHKMIRLAEQATSTFDLDALKRELQELHPNDPSIRELGSYEETPEEIKNTLMDFGYLLDISPDDWVDFGEDPSEYQKHLDEQTAIRKILHRHFPEVSEQNPYQVPIEWSNTYDDDDDEDYADEAYDRITDLLDRGQYSEAMSAWRGSGIPMTDFGMRHRELLDVLEQSGDYEDDYDYGPIDPNSIYAPESSDDNQPEVPEISGVPADPKKKLRSPWSKHIIHYKAPNRPLPKEFQSDDWSSSPLYQDFNFQGPDDYAVNTDKNYGVYQINHPRKEMKEPPIGYLQYHTQKNDQGDPSVHVDLLDTHPHYRLHGVATALLQALAEDYPNHLIDPGFTTEHGTGFVNYMRQNAPGANERLDTSHWTASPPNKVTPYQMQEWGVKEKRSPVFASSQFLYRGMGIDHDFDPDEHPHSRIDRILDDLASISHEGGGLGSHWTTDPSIAREFAEDEGYFQGRLPVMLKVKWNGRGRNKNPPDDVLSADSLESEVPLLSGIPLHINEVHFQHPDTGSWHGSRVPPGRKMVTHKKSVFAKHLAHLIIQGVEESQYPDSINRATPFVNELAWKQVNDYLMKYKTDKGKTRRRRFYEIDPHTLERTNNKPEYFDGFGGLPWWEEKPSRRRKSTINQALKVIKEAEEAEMQWERSYSDGDWELTTRTPEGVDKTVVTEPRTQGMHYSAQIDPYKSSSNIPDQSEPHPDDFWGGGGCAALALGFKSLWPDLKIGAEWDNKDHTLNHAWVYGNDGRSHDWRGSRPGIDDPAPYHDYNSQIEMDVDPQKLARSMRLKWNPESPWDDDSISEAADAIEQHWMGKTYDPETGDWNYRTSANPGGGITPDMDVSRQIRKFDQAIAQAQEQDDHQRATYLSGLKDWMLEELEQGRPRSYSFYAPMVDEEFGERTSAIDTFAYRLADSTMSPSGGDSTVNPSGGTPPSGLSSAASLAQSASGKPYDYGGSGQPGRGYDCSGYVGDIYNALTGKPTGTPRDPAQGFSTTTNFADLGFKPGYNPNVYFNIGVNPAPGEQGHMAGELNGVPIESSETGGTQYGGNALGPNAPQFTQQWHLPNEMIVP